MNKANIQSRGLVVAGLGGGSGKSVVAVGLAAAFTRQGRIVIPFKKGPDYIDAGWLALAARNPCYNLDPYLMTQGAIQQSFEDHARKGEVIIVEGNRGLYDGVDAEGTYSTAELSKSLKLPVLLVVDCTKTTRTVAALVLGCQSLDKDVEIKGVVLNRIGSKRHENIVREAVERYTGISVLGAIRRSKQDVFPQRHLGVTPCPEHEGADSAVATLADNAEKYLDLAKIEDILENILDTSVASEVAQSAAIGHDLSPKVRIGVLKDAAFQFYYAENLEALQREGAELVEINALTEAELPQIDGLYIGGGFPETSAQKLSANVSFRKAIKSAAEKGMPIYAECGGLIYLGESMVLDGEVFPLAGVFPVQFGLEKKPQAHGYTVLETETDNPFYSKDAEIKGHEFRYSKVLEWKGDSSLLAFKMKRGVGFVEGRDGLVYKNVLALYTHTHSIGTPSWAPSFVEKAHQYQQGS